MCITTSWTWPKNMVNEVLKGGVWWYRVKRGLLSSPLLTRYELGIEEKKRWGMIERYANVAYKVLLRVNLVVHRDGNFASERGWGGEGTNPKDHKEGEEWDAKNRMREEYSLLSFIWWINRCSIFPCRLPSGDHSVNPVRLKPRLQV